MGPELDDDYAPHFPGPPDTSQWSQQELDEYIEAGTADSISYARLILGVDIWPKQEELMRAVNRYTKVAVAGANSTGKTFSMSPETLYRLTMLSRISVLQIAPTLVQSKGVFWRDMNGLYDDSPLAQELLDAAKMHGMSFPVSARRYAQAVSPGDTKALRGYHNENMLFVLDEGNGVDADYYTAIDGIAASGEITIVQLGNPTENSGIFYDSFNEADLGWYTMHISAFDSPNMLNLEVPDWFDEESDAPGIITPDNRRKLAYVVYLRRQVLEKRNTVVDERTLPEYKELALDVTNNHLTKRKFVADGYASWAVKNHPSWWGQVLGTFPDESEDQLINRKWLDAARGPVHFRPEELDPVVFGCDPSGAGKAEWSLSGAKIRVNDGSMLHEVLFTEGFHGEDAQDDAMERMKPYMHRCMWINIDRVGVGERPMVEIKRWAAQWGVPVLGFPSQAQSTNPVVFANMKAQAYCFLRDVFQVGAITGVNDPLVRRQLLGLRYELTPRGQTRMESKKDMKRRGVSSPDRADSLCYAVFPLMHFIPWQQSIGG